ncbi:hypothetical protein OPV22_033883 [Ensete ventricosum]|uniref:E3 ubiquitin-protein ligase RNF170 n=1 Tax=Ensete ventricosum TaxID=4639 RepID=A0AAV8PZI4_ENSVE|nr:hypothetical protein OPV22_033883 [Ensete ventricosum]
MESPPEEDFCSICHDSFTLPCQANCSHWFCGHCILRVWHHGSALQPCKCPICRRVITLLIPTDAAVQERQDPEASRVLENIEKYNRNFGGGSSSLIQRLRDLPFFIRRLLREMMDPQRSLPFVLRVRVILAMALSAIYVLSPVDIIPEGVFGFVGFLDDLIILLIVFLHLATVYRSVLLYRHGAVIAKRDHINVEEAADGNYDVVYHQNSNTTLKAEPKLVLTEAVCSILISGLMHHIPCYSSFTLVQYG